MVHLGICHDAFETSFGLVFGFLLYTDAQIARDEPVTAKLLSDGVEVDEVSCSFGIVLSGERHRYDMDRVSVIAKGGVLKSDVVGKEVVLLCPYEFWQPPSEP